MAAVGQPAARQAHAPVYENTYIMKPEGYGKARTRSWLPWALRCTDCRFLTRPAAQMQSAKFNPSEVSSIVQLKLANRLEGVEYDAATAAQVSLAQSASRLSAQLVQCSKCSRCSLPVGVAKQSHPRGRRRGCVPARQWILSC